MNGVTTESKLVRAVTTTNNYIHIEQPNNYNEEILLTTVCPTPTANNYNQLFHGSYDKGDYPHQWLYGDDSFIHPLLVDTIFFHSSLMGIFYGPIFDDEKS